MFRFFVLACTIALVAAGIKPGKPVKRVAEQRTQASEIGEISVSYSGHELQGEEELHAPSGKGGKYASSSELTSLAHNSALQAKAITRNQQTAGSQAAFSAQVTLAQAAAGAANTAQAALVGKQVIVQNLKNQLHDAEKQLKIEIAQYEQTQKVAAAAQETASQAQQQINTLTAALAAIQEGVQQAQHAAAEAAGSAAAQHHMIQEAEQKVAYLTQKYHNALFELKETEGSALKAAAAAQQAQSNAAAAGGAVALSAAKNEVPVSGHDEYHH